MSYTGRHRDPEQLLPGQFFKANRPVFVVLLVVILGVMAILSMTQDAPSPKAVTVPSQQVTVPWDEQYPDEADQWPLGEQVPWVVVGVVQSVTDTVAAMGALS